MFKYNFFDYWALTKKYLTFLCDIFLDLKFSRCVDCIFVINISDGFIILVKYLISPKLFVPNSKIANDDFKFKFRREINTPNSLL